MEMGDLALGIQGHDIGGGDHYTTDNHPTPTCCVEDTLLYANCFSLLILSNGALS